MHEPMDSRRKAESWKKNRRQLAYSTVGTPGIAILTEFRFPPTIGSPTKFPEAPLSRFMNSIFFKPFGHYLSYYSELEI